MTGRRKSITRSANEWFENLSCFERCPQEIAAPRAARPALAGQDGVHVEAAAYYFKFRLFFELRSLITRYGAVSCTGVAVYLKLKEFKLRKLRALIIDDDHDVGDSLGLLLEILENAIVHVAYDGLSGVAAMDVFKPDLVFVDLGMPDIDGFETARRIRQANHAHKFILVALTGWGENETRRRTRQAGFDMHLTKPADMGTIETLAQLARAA